MRPLLLFSLVCGMSLLSSSSAELAVDIDFEGASALVSTIDQQARIIEFQPAGDPAQGWPCWWSLQVTGLTPGETFSLVVHPSDKIIPLECPTPRKGKPLESGWSAPARAAYSTDGETWLQTEPGTSAKTSMTYQIKAPAERVYVAWGPTYTPSRAAAFVRAAAEKSPGAQAQTLATSLGGRAVPMLHIAEGALAAEQRPALWFSARQHAWESGSSWVAQGLAEWLLGADEHAQWLRQHTEIFLVPVMDVDHVATGQGGKEGVPQDHNRDWSDDPHWPEVRAAQALIAGLAKQGRLRSFIDLHNPAPGDRLLHFYIPPEEGSTPPQRAAFARFEALAKPRIGAVMPVLEAPRTSGPAYDRNWMRMSQAWAAQHGGDGLLSVCIETPWNIVQSNQEGYRKVGAAVGETMYSFLQPE